jgi:SagB-type dehydrogenase family enzyme
MKNISMTVAALLLMSAGIFGQDYITKLPPPSREGGMPLMEALQNRRSQRDYQEGKALSSRQMSDLLWACWGINRPSGGGRTAPSADDNYEMEVFVVTAQGIYLYLAEDHALELIREGDFRAETSTQSYPAKASVNLVYVADLSRTGGATAFSLANTGFMAQNVYLYCASEGLGCCVRALYNREKLSEALDLGLDEEIILAQSVGFLRD